MGILRTVPYRQANSLGGSKAQRQSLNTSKMKSSSCKFTPLTISPHANGKYHFFPNKRNVYWTANENFRLQLKGNFQSSTLNRLSKLLGWKKNWSMEFPNSQFQHSPSTRFATLYHALLRLREESLLSLPWPHQPRVLQLTHLLPLKEAPALKRVPSLPLSHPPQVPPGSAFSTGQRHPSASETVSRKPARPRVLLTIPDPILCARVSFLLGYLLHPVKLCGTRLSGAQRVPELKLFS